MLFLLLLDISYDLGIGTFFVDFVVLFAVVDFTVVFFTDSSVCHCCFPAVFCSPAGTGVAPQIFCAYS